MKKYIRQVDRIKVLNEQINQLRADNEYLGTLHHAKAKKITELYSQINQQKIDLSRLAARNDALQFALTLASQYGQDLYNKSQASYRETDSVALAVGETPKQEASWKQINFVHSNKEKK